jgi:hypothetical protein
MSSPTYIGAAIACFVITALLYLQSIEHFTGDVPADLTTAPISKPVSVLPQPKGATTSIPGSTSITPKDALATRNELAELDSKLMTWLDAASQREVENPMALTDKQRQMRVEYQARVSSIRQQLGTGLIIDKSKDVVKDIMQLRTQNAEWQTYRTYVNTDSFNPAGSETSFVTKDDYKEFRGIMSTALTSLKANALSNPLDLVRLKQLEQIDTELRVTDEQGRIPLIRVRVAKSFLKLMLDSSQPLPSLITMDGLYPQDI